MSYEEMKLTNSPQTFTKYLSTITGKASLKEFLDSNRQLFTSDDADTWLKKSSQAMIVENHLRKILQRMLGYIAS